MKNQVRCTTISVDLVRNETDRELTGYDYYGFDFFVKAEEAVDMMFYVVLLLDQYGTPALDIQIKDQFYLDEDKVWTKEKIKQTFEDNLTFLEEVKQANRKLVN